MQQRGVLSDAADARPSNPTREEEEEEDAYEADECTPLLGPAAASQCDSEAGLDADNRFRRSSHYEGDDGIEIGPKPSWAELMREAESLDTDQLINVVSVEARRIDDGLQGTRLLESRQVHVRRVGLEGWDGQPESCGTYEDVGKLRQIFSAYGECVSAVVRHRVEGEGASLSNTSWAVVTMKDAQSVERAMEAAKRGGGVCAGGTTLELNRFSGRQAAASTGMMQRTRRKSLARIKALIRPSKQRGLLKWGLNALIGIAVGLTAYFMEWSIETITETRVEHMQKMLDRHLNGPGSDDHLLCSPEAHTLHFACLWRYLPAFAVHFGCAFTFVMTTVLLVYLAPAAAGSGVSLVMAYLNGLHVPKLLSAKTLGSKIFGTILIVASGLPLGPEGPLVHIGAGVASFFTRQHTIRICGRRYCSSDDISNNMFNNDFDRREFISSGAAVGLAAAFGAPIGGVLYALEETSSFWSQRVTWRALLCTTLGTFTLALFHGHFLKLGASGLLSFSQTENAYFIWELLIFVIVAMVGGCVGALFVVVYQRTERLRGRSTSGKFLEAGGVVVFVSTISFFVPMAFGRCIPKPVDACNIDCAACNVTSCELSHVGRCIWDEASSRNGNNSGDGTCFGPTDTATLLTANCPSDRYNDLATLFLASREGVISKLMRMRVAVGSDCAAARGLPHPADEMGAAFSQESLAIFLVLNFLCILLSFGISVPSGLFMPSIMTGATFGALIGTQMRRFVVHITDYDICDDYFETHVQPGLYALVGAAAMLAGVFRSSISLAVILLEGTGQIQFLLPILLTIGVAKITADVFVEGLNEVQLHMKEMPFLHHEPSHGMHVATAADAMSSPVKKFRSVERASVIAQTIEGCKHNGFPVCSVEQGPDGRYCTDRVIIWCCRGLISRAVAESVGYLKGSFCVRNCLCSSHVVRYMCCAVFCF
jgi:chloride channel 7